MQPKYTILLVFSLVVFIALMMFRAEVSSYLLRALIAGLAFVAIGFTKIKGKR
jgi:hypothetical protein